MTLEMQTTTSTVAPPRRSLFDISDDLAILDELMFECDGDITDPEVEAQVTAWFEELENEREAKLEGYGWYIKELKVRHEAYKAEAARLAQRAQTEENKRKRLMTRLVDHFKLSNLTKIKTKSFIFGRQSNGGKFPMEFADGYDLAKVPAQFVKQVPTLDTDAVYHALQDGIEIPGITLGERGEHIRIR
ncbi:MAG: siphovirus Gp157 family protein [Pyrinomonadaceae bacterium]